MYGGGFQFNRNLVKGSIRSRQLPRAQSGVIMAPNGTSSPAALPFSNMESFLDAVTPRIPAKHLSKNRKKNTGTYFVLNDLWETFDEWSAYGAGAPLVLYDGEPVVQYYVPYLSAIQIYTHPKPQPKSRKGIRNSEGGSSSKGSNSDASINSESERISTNINTHQHPHHQTTNISSILGKLSLREQKVFPQEGLSTDESESANSRGNLLYEHLESDPPFTRGALYEKISELASQFPELKTMRSCDLHPSSWFSIAWYPIYRLPSGPTVKELGACFLTYHSLCTPTRASPATPGVHAPRVYPDEKSGFPKIALPSFGLSYYKFRASMWIGNNERSRMLVNSLSNGANNWLRFLNVHHPDHAFFVSRR